MNKIHLSFYSSNILLLVRALSLSLYYLFHNFDFTIQTYYLSQFLHRRLPEFEHRKKEKLFFSYLTREADLSMTLQFRNCIFMLYILNQSEKHSPDVKLDKSRRTKDFSDSDYFYWTLRREKIFSNLKTTEKTDENLSLKCLWEDDLLNIQLLKCVNKKIIDEIRQMYIITINWMMIKIMLTHIDIFIHY